MQKYIDSETFDIIDNPDFFEVDIDIAEAVSILNKKGYRTIFSCSGHNRNGFLSHTIKKPIEHYEGWLEKYGDDPNAHLVDKDDNYFYHKDDEAASYIYIAFDKKYNFEFLPEGFDYTDYDNIYSVNKFCEFFEDGKRRLDKEIDKELKQSQELLLDWAKKLKDLNADVSIDDNLGKYKRDYILSKIKLDNFYLLWNSTNNIGLIKDLFSYKVIKSNSTRYDEYRTTLYKELFKSLLDILYHQLKTLNCVLFNTYSNDINILYKRIPTDIKNLLNKNNIDNNKLEDVIKLFDNMEHYKTDTVLYDIQQYCDYIQDILEMFYESDKWFNERKKYLKSVEGNNELCVYEKYISKKI